MQRPGIEIICSTTEQSGEQKIGFLKKDEAGLDFGQIIAGSVSGILLFLFRVKKILNIRSSNRF